MDNTEITTQQESAQSGGLFAYIANQQAEAVSDESLVAQLETEAPTTLTDASNVENVTPAASTPEPTQDGVTTQPELPQDDEADRLRQQVQELENRQQRQLAAMALLATQARQREDAIFEESLKLMDEDEANAARQRRDTERQAAELEFYKSQHQQSLEAQQASQEQADKVQVATVLMNRLGLPMDDQFIASALMAARNPAEMIATANQIRTVRQQYEQQAAAVTAQQAAQTGVHRAGGETAPAAPPRKVPERKGELIDMMREVQYETYQQM